MSEITFSDLQFKGSSRQRQMFVNVSQNGVPFGQIWTYKAKVEKHPWHSKPLDGDHKTHNSLQEAKQRMIDENTVTAQSMQAD